MKNKENQSKVAVNPNPLNYRYPYYVQIEDGDEESIKFYKGNGVPVAYIRLPHRLPHYYAVFSAESREEAAEMNRMFNNMDKHEQRSRKAREENETSYDDLLESGYDAVQDGSDPAEIVAYRTVIEALNRELNMLTDEKLRQCRMVAEGKSERGVAKEMGIPRTTLSTRKNVTLKELGRRMKDYR